MNYYDTEKQQIHTELHLKSIGVNLENPDVLKALHLVPIFYNYPEYNTETQYIESDGDLVYDDEKHQYVQNFKIIDIPQETIEENNLRKLEEAKYEAKTLIADTRWQYEVSGIFVNTTFIQTSLNDRNRLISSYEGMVMNNEDTINFKTTNGWEELTQEQMRYIVSCIKTHIQNCYNAEKILTDKVDNATTVEEIKAININDAEAENFVWPDIRFSNIEIPLSVDAE